MKTLYIAIVSVLLMLSACSTARVETGPSAQVKQACPMQLGEANHHDFGGVTSALAEMYKRYFICATAANAGVTK